MPRAWKEYGFGDWLALRPPLHRWKERRYRRVDGAALRAPHRFGDLADLRRRVAGRRVLVTVGFDDVEALAMQRRLVLRHVDHDLHLIADNSSRDESADAIRRLADETGALYGRAPPNPWTGRNNSRSHGLAMNWAWRSVLRPAAPLAFGFLDHDLFPTAPVAPFALLDSVPFHGDIRRAGGRWFLWAGYCFFRPAALATNDLDFGLDWFAGLDTGGANWNRLYRFHDPLAVPANAIRAVAALPGVPREQAYFEWRNDWLHEVGWAATPELRTRKRLALKALLAPFLGAPE